MLNKKMGAELLPGLATLNIEMKGLGVWLEVLIAIRYSNWGQTKFATYIQTKFSFLPPDHKTILQPILMGQKLKKPPMSKQLFQKINGCLLRLKRLPFSTTYRHSDLVTTPYGFFLLHKNAKKLTVCITWK